jgi:hypothetical protein
VAGSTDAHAQDHGQRGEGSEREQLLAPYYS